MPLSGGGFQIWLREYWVRYSDLLCQSVLPTWTNNVTISTLQICSFEESWCHQKSWCSHCHSMSLASKTRPCAGAHKSAKPNSINICTNAPFSGAEYVVISGHAPIDSGRLRVSTCYRSSQRHDSRRAPVPLTAAVGFSLHPECKNGEVDGYNFGAFKELSKSTLKHLEASADSPKSRATRTPLLGTSQCRRWATNAKHHSKE